MRSGSVSSATRGVLEKAQGNKLSGKIVPTRLYTHNADVDAENDKELEKLPGASRAYEMSSKGKASIVESLEKGILAPETLR